MEIIIPQVSVSFVLGVQQATINVFRDTETNRLIELPKNKWDYGTIVNAIIRSEYTNDQVEAIINNYLLNPEDEEAASEMSALQEFRAKAKAEAHSCLEYAEENNLWVHQNVQ